MNTIEEFTSYALGILSLCFGSIGTLTPEKVKRAGNVFANWLHAESKWSLLEAARMKSGHRAQKEDWWDDIRYQCGIQLAVFALTTLLSFIFTIIASLVGGICAAQSLQSYPVGHPWRATLLGVSAILLMIPMVGLYDMFRAYFPGRKRAFSIWFRLTKHIEIPVFGVPFYCIPMFYLVSIFTMHVPRGWYEAIKVVNRNGMNWLLVLLALITGVAAIGIPAYAKVRSMTLQ